MKLSKQTRDGIVLGTLLLVLVVVAFFVLRPSSAQSPKSKTTASTAKKDSKHREAKSTPDDMTWAEDTLRLGSAIGEVSGGRNPFDDLLPSGTNTPGRASREVAKLPASTEPRPVVLPSGPLVPDRPGMGTLPPLTVPEEPVAQPVKTHWVTLAEVKALIAREKLGVRIEPTKKADTFTLSGPRQDVEDAAAAIADGDGEPPVPEFVLTVAITSAHTRFAVITVGGTTYSLYEGEKIPALGWTVTQITATGVVMKKGKQSKPIRLGGGKA
jgi:hypothetical protein